MPYSDQLFSLAHPANQLPPTRHCCLDAHEPQNYILCATCYKREQPVEEEWQDDYTPPGWSPTPVQQEIPGSGESSVAGGGARRVAV